MENICDSISIFDVASKFGVALKGKGKLYCSPFRKASKFGVALKGKGKLYCSPFRKDEHPSFSIFGNGKLFKDLATGETGNVISFTAKLKGISNKEAYKLLLSEFDNGSFKAVSSGRHSLDRNEEKKTCKGEIDAPKELLWNDSFAEILAKRYSVSVVSLKHAFNVGCFGFGRSKKNGRCLACKRQSKIELSNPKNGRQQLEILGQRSKSVDSEKQRLQLSDRLGKRKGQASDMHLRGVHGKRKGQASDMHLRGVHRFPVVLPYSENAQYARHSCARCNAWCETQNRYSLFARVFGEGCNDFCGCGRSGI